MVGQVSWNKTKLEKIREKVKSSVDPFPDYASRLEHCMTNIRELEAATEPEQHISRFFYIVYALLNHKVCGKLSAGQVRRLQELGSVLLRTQGIEPRSTRQSFLYRDLHLVLSQIYRREGKFWPSIWEQQLSFYFDPYNQESEQAGLNDLALAIRATRIGHGPIARRSFSEAQKKGLVPRSNARAVLGEIKILRLGGHAPMAKKMAEEALAGDMLTENEKKECHWELMCAEATQSGNIEKLLYSVRRGKDHYEPSYVVDAFFWSRSVKKSEFIQRFPTCGSLARGLKKDFKKLGGYYKTAIVLEKCYDTDIPIGLRLEQASQMSAHAKDLLTIERELLLWATLGRWLARSKQLMLAALSLAEYRSLSLRLSGGHNEDALGVVSDLLASGWFVRYVQEPMELKEVA